MSDVLRLFGNPVFWIFGGGVIIALVAIISDLFAKTLRLRQRTLELMQQQRQSADTDLTAVSPTEFENLRQRVVTLERDMEEVRQERGLPRAAAPAQQVRRTMEPEVVSPPVEDVEAQA